MNVTKAVPHKNNLLAALPSKDFEALSARLEFLEMPENASLEVAHEPIDFVYFIETGVASIVASSPTNLKIEIGLVGFEGMSGASIVLGDTENPFDCYMQIAGTAHRVATDDFVELLSASRSMERFFMKYSRLLAIQNGYTTLAAGKVKFENRLARWLLMLHDRMQGDHFNVTHDFLALMLGSHRPAATIALQVLEGEGAIRNNRKSVLIRDRALLERIAGGTYGLAEREYERLIGRPVMRTHWVPSHVDTELQRQV